MISLWMMRRLRQDLRLLGVPIMAVAMITALGEEVVDEEGVVDEAIMVLLAVGTMVVEMITMVVSGLAMIGVDNELEL